MTFASVVLRTAGPADLAAVAELEDLFVVPIARHRGLGRRLIADSVVWAREQGCQRMELVVATGSGWTVELKAFEHIVDT
jgi:GNAT superfamily N-acetyltransferase